MGRGTFEPCKFQKSSQILLFELLIFCWDKKYVMLTEENQEYSLFVAKVAMKMLGDQVSVF